MDFLVTMELRWPPDRSLTELDALAQRETEAGRGLLAAGVLRAIWRVPGRSSNVGIWSAPDASALHDHLTSLPLFRWLDIKVQALAIHPVEARDAQPLDHTSGRL